jgi:hypothetical protein
MNSQQVKDNLLVIRTLMERAAIYQRAVRPVLFLAGSVGTAAAVAGYFFTPLFAVYWTAIAVVVLAGAFYVTRRQALKDGEKFWSPPARRVAVAMLPMMVIGLVLTASIYQADVDYNGILVAFWLMLYGCAIHTAGMFAPTRLRVLGWLCVAGGLILLGYLATQQPFMPERYFHAVMGIFFGLLHLAFGLIPAKQ